MAIKGSITLDEIFIIEVDADPTVDGVDAPISSIALLDSPSDYGMWLKVGSSPTDWKDIANQKAEASGFIDGGSPSTVYDTLVDIDGGSV